MLGVEGMAFTKNNEIIATGDNYNTFKFFALKLNENGVVNKSFGTNGLAILSLPAHLLYVGRNCGILQNGNIVISGYYASGTANNTNIVVGRLTSDGFPDTTFSKYGIIEVFVEDNTGRATTMLIDKNDKILIGGADEENHGQDDFLLIRLESSGKRTHYFEALEW
ncbi:MAG: hypothetical protein IPP06_00055 [Saprospiraceae bacterium]|nr:hypothetical protein [Candidatus Vicinibacter affinis]